ncbi:MAG: hypothetical protein IJU71_11385, partial [Selenomonadaceae bacterium]|nr:hypothetical protein [Selenomonadaceae bacterium]
LFILSARPLSSASIILSDAVHFLDDNQRKGRPPAREAVRPFYFIRPKPLPPLTVINFLSDDEDCHVRSPIFR